MKQMRFFLMCLLWLLPACVSAMDHYVSGDVKDVFDHKPLPGVNVSLLKTDSTVVSTASAKIDPAITPPRAGFRLPVKESGSYILKFTMLGYQTAYADIEVKIAKRVAVVEVGTFYIQEQVYKLKEVTARATKIKMVMKGDTVIYNADAFQLAQGSMLDALIEQLPGVELRDNGQIYANGRFVENLMLNGKNFFKGDPKVALENLPAYMVDKVKVYEYAGEMSQFMGKDMGDESYVMDVHLKKQYAIGWIANAEAGGGTQNRYLGKVFGLCFTPVSRFSVFANFNNLNDNQTPGRTGNWSPQSVEDGLQTTWTGGLSYQYEKGDFKQKYVGVTTDNKIQRYDVNSESQTSSVSFLPGGDSYGRSANRATNKSFNFYSSNNFTYVNHGWWWEISPNILYQKSDYSSFGSRGVFNADPDWLVGSQALDSLFAPDMGEAFRKIIVNRQKQEYQRNHDVLNSSATVSLSRRINNGNFWSMDAVFGYVNTKESVYNRYKIDYFSQPSRQSDYRDQYWDKPFRRYSYNVRTRYDYTILDDRPNEGPFIMLKPYYQFSFVNFSDRNSLYRLDQLPGWEEEGGALGTLPSNQEALQGVFDGKNSYRIDGGHIMANNAKVEFTATDFFVGDLVLGGSLTMQGQFYKRDLDYFRNDRYYRLKRSGFLPSPSVSFSVCSKDFWSKAFRISYKIKSDYPDWTYEAAIRDDSDPLNIYEGNRQEDVLHHYVDVSYDRSWAAKQRSLSITAGYRYTHNAFVTGYTYNRETGVRTYRPDNVNGNYNVNGYLRYNTPVDKQRKLTFATTTGASYNHNVDLIGVEGYAESQRSTVHNLYLSQNFKLDYQINDKIKAGFKANGVYTRATSHRDNFHTVNAGDVNYGLTGIAELPWNMQFSTDLTMYSRRGYEDPAMNTDEMVWNARLSKTCMKGNLTFMVDGFDILGNLSNIRRTLNAQGRVETYYNVVPRYVLFHAIYRLNIQPKKKR